MDLEPPLRIGTRGSDLAWHEASAVARLLQQKGLTQGYDMIPVGGPSIGGDPSSFAGGALQTTLLRQALAREECDIAIHFAKDLPTGSRIKLGAVLPRHDPREALCSLGATLDELPPAARVGVPKGVRPPQLLALRPDLQIVNVRGPLETRLDMITAGKLDAVVVSHAIIAGCGLEHWVTELFPLSKIVPTPAQGITVVELGPQVSPRIKELVASLCDQEARIRLLAERRFQTLVAEQTAAPIGAGSDVVVHGPDRVLRLRVVVCGQDETLRAVDEIVLDDDGTSAAQEMAERVADHLSDQIARLRVAPAADKHARPRVMYDSSSVGEVGEAYRRCILAGGADPVPVALATTKIASDEDLDEILEQMSGCTRVGIASARVVHVLAERARQRGTTLEEVLSGVTVGAISAPAAAALADEFVSFEVVPTASVSAESLIPIWPRVTDGHPVTVLPGSNNSSPVIGRILRSLGWDVREPIVYTRTPAPCGPEQQAAMDDGWPDAIILSTRTSVQSFEAMYGLPPAGVRVVAVGRYAGQDATDLGLQVVVASSTRVEDVVRLALTGL